MSIDEKIDEMLKERDLCRCGRNKNSANFAYHICPSFSLKEAIKQLMEEQVKQFITDVYGERCKNLDKYDFPDTKNSERCPCCEQWEMYDDWFIRRKNND